MPKNKPLDEKAVRDLSNNPIPNYYWEKDVKEFIEIVEKIIIRRKSRRLQLLELRKRAGGKLI